MAIKLACLLCGSETEDTRIALIAWRNPIDHERYAAIPRCRDAKACRERVEAGGDSWEVDEPGAKR